MKDLSGTVQAAMRSLGTYDGRQWFWAEPGSFTKPGLYYWDGSTNVLAFAYPPPTAPAMKDELKAVVKSLEHSHVSAVGDAEAARVDTNREYCTGKANAFAYALSLLRPVADRLAATPPAASAEAREGVELSKLIRSRLFQQFVEQGFWHAHHVDLVWRYNGEDVREQADWLKDLWYALKDGTHAPAPELSEQEREALEIYDRAVRRGEHVPDYVFTVVAALRRVAK